MDANVALVIANCVLIVITGFYLYETRKIRQIATKSFLIESAPKVYVEEIISKPNLNESKKEIEIAPIFQIVNVGKTEAKNFRIDYTLSSGRIKLEDKTGPIPSLYPGQRLSFTTKLMGVGLNDEQVATAKAASLAGTPYELPITKSSPIILDITLSYIDQDMKEQKSSLKLEYNIKANIWALKAAE